MKTKAQNPPVPRRVGSVLLLLIACVLAGPSKARPARLESIDLGPMGKQNRFHLVAHRLDLVAGRSLRGSGTLLGDVVSQGNVAPGHSPGQILVQGSVTLQSPSVVLMEIGGTAAGTQFDQVVQQGGAGTVLGGELMLTMINSFQNTIQSGNTFAILTSDQALSGSFSNVASGGRLATTDGSGSFKVTYAGQTAVTLSDFQSGMPPIQLTSTVSRKMHGALGPFDIILPAVEPRSSGGSHTLVFSFTNNLTSGSASVTSGTGSVQGTPVISGNTLTAQLTGVADAQQLTVTLSGVTDEFSQTLPSTPVTMRVLSGDTNGNSTVNGSDVAQTKAQAGVTVSTTNFFADVTPNGTINASDVSLVKSRSGSSIPPAAPETASEKEGLVR